MNIIEALQALKEGKKIKRAAWKHLKYIVLMGNKIKDDLGGGFNLCVLSENLYEDDWELYAEPLKLTAEERKALELVKACGYDLIWYDTCFLWARVRGEDEAGVADDDFPPLRALKGLFPRATNPTSIDSLLEEAK